MKCRGPHFLTIALLVLVGGRAYAEPCQPAWERAVADAQREGDIERVKLLKAFNPIPVYNTNKNIICYVKLNEDIHEEKNFAIYDVESKQNGDFIPPNFLKDIKGDQIHVLPDDKKEEFLRLKQMNQYTYEWYNENAVWKVVGFVIDSRGFLVQRHYVLEDKNRTLASLALQTVNVTNAPVYFGKSLGIDPQILFKAAADYNKAIADAAASAAAKAEAQRQREIKQAAAEEERKMAPLRKLPGLYVDGSGSSIKIDPVSDTLFRSGRAIIDGSSICQYNLNGSEFIVTCSYGGMSTLYTVMPDGTISLVRGNKTIFYKKSG